ncbi:hypothetical protein KFK09_005229 [Dendrobium nobile]|uniref:Uncharacterized protein n=1 Tax=Dendrobium nobile TaxID=94219 RepID=A0A8T3BV55_DENNO|nr:hypothetical protein KFK09_005229 [Dendrobium nobile]
MQEDGKSPAGAPSRRSRSRQRNWDLVVIDRARAHVGSANRRLDVRESGRLRLGWLLPAAEKRNRHLERGRQRGAAKERSRLLLPLGVWEPGRRLGLREARWLGVREADRRGPGRLLPAAMERRLLGGASSEPAIMEDG